jgi:hypothetical protein
MGLRPRFFLIGLGFTHAVRSPSRRGHPATCSQLCEALLGSASVPNLQICKSTLANVQADLTRRPSYVLIRVRTSFGPRRGSAIATGCVATARILAEVLVRRTSGAASAFLRSFVSFRFWFRERKDLVVIKLFLEVFAVSEKVEQLKGGLLWLLYVLLIVSSKSCSRKSCFRVPRPLIWIKSVGEKIGRKRPRLRISGQS